jgi:hypothetical protein
MASDSIITIVLDDEKVKKLEEVGLANHISEESGGKALKVPLPQKNQRKFKKAFSTAILNDQTGEVDKFPEDAAALLFDSVIEHKTVEVMHLFLLKAFKPLAGKELRHRVH